MCKIHLLDLRHDQNLGYQNMNSSINKKRVLTDFFLLTEAK